MEEMTFRQYLKESGYDLLNYQQEVYEACLELGNYENIDIYYQKEIEDAFEEQKPILKLAAELCARFDTEYGKPKPVEEPEFFEDEYSQETMDAMANYPQDSFDEISESTESEEKKDDGISDGESYDEWKTNAFKYIDKRVDVDKIKELGTYIKDFLKQEYDNGEPSWFMAAESIVNYARINYPDALKDRSFATTITESTEKVNKVTLLNDIRDWFKKNSEYYFINKDVRFSIKQDFRNHSNIVVFKINLLNAPVKTTLTFKIYSNDTITVSGEGDNFATKEYELEDYDDLNKLIASLEECYGSLDEATDTKMYSGWVEFVSEDAAFDGLEIWENVKHPKIKPMSAFDPWTAKSMKLANRLKDVSVKKTDNTRLTITGPKKVLVDEAIALFNEDEDSIVTSSKAKLINPEV